jgi:hypothetical protein
MATVTGLTAERMIEMENATVIDGDVVGNDLVLRTRDGTQINAGNVRGPQGPAGLNGAGHIICTSTTRPSLVAGDEGKTIYETDTDLVRTWTGTRWKLQERIICTYATRPTGLGTVDDGIAIYETDTNDEYVWSGTTWVASNIGKLLGSFVSTASNDVVQGSTEIMATVTFSVATQRLVRIEFTAAYSMVTSSSNGNTYLRPFIDGTLKYVYGATHHALGVGGIAGGGAACNVTLAAGSHTIDIRATNAASTNCAMRFAPANVFLDIFDYGRV